MDAVQKLQQNHPHLFGGITPKKGKRVSITVQGITANGTVGAQTYYAIEVILDGTDQAVWVSPKQLDEEVQNVA